MNQVIKQALSYDDVLLEPKYSRINSKNLVDLKTQITPRVTLNIPLISINMTDVTGVKMAIALAKLGGLGFLPRFISPEEQANMVSRVKKENCIAAAAIGCREGYLKRAEVLVNAGVDLLTLDVTHGHMQKVLDATSRLKRKFGKKVDIVSGVIATKEGARETFLKQVPTV